MKPGNPFCVLLICLLFTLTATAGEPPGTPFIRIDATMHSAQIADIATNASGKLIATASADKTVKIWEAATGKLVRTLRPPIAFGVEGVLNAVALSAEGTLVATGGYTGFTWDNDYSIYLFDVGTGEMTRRIGGFSHPVLRLAFSPDGKRLAVGHNRSGGVDIVNLDDNKRITDNIGFKGNCFGIDYDALGNLIAASDDGIIRMYRPDGTTAYSLQTDNGKMIYSLRFSPDGRHFAVGYDDRDTVEVRNTTDGSVAFVLQEPKGYMWSVAWSADGRYLMAAGGKQESGARKILVKWSVASRRVDEQIVLPSKNGITKLLPLKNGSIVFASRQSGFGVIDSENVSFYSDVSGKRGRKKTGNLSEVSISEGSHSFFNSIATADFQKNYDSFKISSEAGSVLFSYERHGQAKALFDVIKRKIVTHDFVETGMVPPRFTGNGVDIQNWKNSSQPRLNRIKLKSFGSREKSQSLSVRHDDSGFVIGTNHYLRSYSHKGILLWKRRISHVAWNVAISADNAALVATLDDGTIRWHRMTDGKELYSVYLHPDRKRWILWSPEGYFDHGPDSESLIGFLVNRGADKSSSLVSVDQMYDIFYRPDLIDRIIAGENISGYLQRLNVPAKNASVNKGLPSAEIEKQGQKTSMEERAALLKADEEIKSALQVLKAAAEQKKRDNVSAEKPAQEQAEKEQAEKERSKLEQIASGKSEARNRDITLPEDDVPSLDSPMANDDSATVLQNAALTGLINVTTLPPTVRFISKSSTSEARDFTIKSELCDNGGGIGNVTLFLNNTPVSFERGDRGLVIRTKSAPQPCLNFERVVTLAPGQNVLSLAAFNRDNTIESDRDQVTLNYISTENAKSRLHILSIAVNSYRDGDLRLNYSINDAEGVIGLVTEKAKPLFSGIDTYRLHNEQVTKANMEEIFARIGAKTKRGDVFLLFMAGHGVTDDSDGMYYFLPVDFRYTGQESLVKQGISMNDFKRYLAGVLAMKTLLLIDTCNSGSFSEAAAARGVTDKTAITKLARAVGRATIAASSKNQVALEGYEGHGVFSYTVMEGMKGKAADKKGEITINHLATFIEETLPELTYKKWGYEQIPQKSLIGSDFPIGIK